MQSYDIAFPSPARQSVMDFQPRVQPTMSVNNKRVFYVKYLAHPIYADILKARADVRLDRVPPRL